MKKGHKMNNSNKKLHQPNKQSNQSTYVQFFFLNGMRIKSAQMNSFW